MPVIKSAAKALRRDKRRTLVNKKIKNNLKKTLKKVRQNPAKENLRQAASVLDRAAKNKIIHKNKANRLKSRLSSLAKRTKGKTPNKAQNKKNKKSKSKSKTK